MYRLLASLILVWILIVSAQSAEAAMPMYKTVQSSSLKDSTKPGAKTIQTLKINTCVSLISKTSTWAYVQYGKSKGYVTLRSIIPLEIPIKKVDYAEVMTYKGTNIVSISGKSLKIDPALLPFFKKNAAALKSTLVKETVKNNTLVGFENLTIGFFTPVNQPFTIDKTAASRIDSLSLHRTSKPQWSGTDSLSATSACI